MRLSWSAIATAFVVAAAVGTSGSGHAAGPGKDPAARGLDVFVHGAQRAAPGGTLSLQAQVFGFPTVTTLTALPGATLDLVWDPESLGKDDSPAQAVHATADASGRVHVDVPVPHGDARSLSLLVGIQSGEHKRTRKLTITRVKPFEVSLHVGDERVVPGTRVPAWVIVRNATTQEPVANKQVELSLLEGGVVRQTVLLTTDAAGSATGRIAIPPVEEPGWRWRLRARVADASEKDSGEDARTLEPRDETPGKPRMNGSWTDRSVLAGGKGVFRVHVWDAVGEPVANLPVKYWIGPKGKNPPTDVDKWDKSATTSSSGLFEVTVDAPSTVAPVVGTELKMFVKTTVDGHELEAHDTLTVGLPTPWVDLTPETRTIVPGLEQQVILQVGDGARNAVKATFRLKGQGLDTEVTTNDDGEASFTWKPPADVGSRREVGPCAGGVATAITVTPKGSVPAFAGRTAPFESCLQVDREATAIVRVEPPVVRAGQKARVRVVGGAGAPWSVALHANSEAMSSGVWLEDGDRGGELAIPANAHGTWTVSAVSPGDRKKARHAQTAILAIPEVLPKVVAQVAGGRLVPGGTAQVDVDLTDGHGHGLVGTVAAVAWDYYGGGGSYGFGWLDARQSLCRAVSVETERCDKFLEADSALDAIRRSRLGDLAEGPNLPAIDPSSDIDTRLTGAFADVVHSLEGAVMESTSSPERLRDARSKTARGWAFNPELLSLVTAAMDTPPETPGGEPFGLADAVAVDPQVTFDNVARRVTRLKLLRVIVEVRSYIREHWTDPNEPALRDPGAILRRMVREGRVSDTALLDPWGGTMQFVRGAGQGHPFLSVKGMELHAPGPDGQLGTPDDVRDPFERVLKTGTPYAKASNEDRVVDARLDMEVAEASVAAWQAVLEQYTGTVLGHGAGTGTGEGFGSGHGRLGGSHRSKAPQVRMGATTVARGELIWIAPVRTDGNGHVRINVPLGEFDTTYAISVVGIPDHARPATAIVQIPTNLPLSGRIHAGDTWTAGDEVDVSVSLRNRGDAPAQVRVSAAVGGVAALAVPSDTVHTVAVPAKGAGTTSFRIKAPKPGEASLRVRVEAPGLAADETVESWTVREAGEKRDVAELQWVEGQTEVELPAAATQGGATLVLERGFEPAIKAAMEALDPDRLRTPNAMADSIEVAARVHRWAVARGGEKDLTAQRAAELARRASGRLKAWQDQRAPKAAWQDVEVRARVSGTLVDKDVLPKPSECPPKGAPTLATALEYLDSEPAPVGGAVPACWDSFLTTSTDLIEKSGDALAYATAILSLAERGHRVHVAAALADRLRERVALKPSGMVSLPRKVATDRSARAIVYAALARAADLGKNTSVSKARLLAWLGAQRDAHGGYGSSLATRSAVRAFLSASRDTEGFTRVIVEVDGKNTQVQVPSASALPVPIAAGARSVRFRTEGQGLMLRTMRKDTRPWSVVPPEVASPVSLEVAWPTDARAGKTSKVRVVLRHTLGRATTVDARVPLPPGARLAEGVSGVRQLQGTLVLRWDANDSSLPHVMEIPIRFGLSGKMTAPEAHARLAYEEAERAIAPARPLKVEP